jgi:SAM-dependent methyltransferase
MDRLRGARPASIPDDFDSYLRLLREKWSDVPTSSQGRVSSHSLLALSDAELAAHWQLGFDDTSVGAGWTTRGWYHELYADLVRRGARVLDVGSGLGHSSIHFARLGARVTFLDVVEPNLEVLARLCRIFGVEDAAFVWLDGLDSIRKLEPGFDVVLALGSLLHTPAPLAALERCALAERLRLGGRWLELAYPRRRWEREGSLPFTKWGEKTDGAGTQWAEWYDVEKLLQSLAPHRFDVVLAHDFHNDDFNWFDLVKR